jgi:hypothetical protein
VRENQGAFRLERQTYTQPSQQSYHDVFTVPPAPEPVRGYGTGTCIIYAIGPFGAKIGDEVASTVSADSEVSLDIFTSELASSFLDNFAHIYDYTDPTKYMANLVSLCITLAYSPHGIKGAYGRSFSVSWKANATGNYYFVFENWKSVVELRGEEYE